MRHELSCVRKNDLKRHIGDFHQVVTEYRCPVQNCDFNSECKQQFSEHLKKDRMHRKVVANDHRYTVCQPAMFACGFASCRWLLETPADGTNISTFGEYVKHVMKHYDQEELPNWSYSTRLQNLLRQSRLREAWQQFGDVDLTAMRFSWEGTTMLRRSLLTGQFSNAQEMVEDAIEIASRNRKSPQWGTSGHLTPRRRNIGRGQQSVGKTTSSRSHGYNLSSKAQEPLTSPCGVMTASAVPLPSPNTYQGSAQTDPAKTLVDVMPQVYARGFPGGRMGANVIQLDPRLYSGVAVQHGFVAQDAETTFAQTGWNNTGFYNEHLTSLH